jgi:2-C-methyl-D-erythritol 4-phosphate cytidylyltransferase
MKTSVLIVAAGSSVRFGGAIPKQYRTLAGKPLLAWTIQRFERAASIEDITLVVPKDQIQFTKEKVLTPYDFKKIVGVVAGGATRQESVLRGLESFSSSMRLVAIHDGARPMVASADIDAVVKEAEAHRAAILATRVAETVKRVKDGYILSTQDRSDLWLAQTPQVFEYSLIVGAHRRAAAASQEATDDAALVESAGYKVCVVEATGPNPKVTTREDLKLVETLLKGDPDA